VTCNKRLDFGGDPDHHDTEPGILKEFLLQLHSGYCTNFSDYSFLSANSCLVFGELGCLTGNTTFDFGTDPDHNPYPGFLTESYHCGIRAIVRILPNQLRWRKLAVSESATYYLLSLKGKM